MGFLSIGSFLVEGITKVDSWVGVKGVLSRLLGVHLCLLRMGLRGLLPYRFQLLAHLPMLRCVLGSVWIRIIVRFILMRGSVVCVNMVVRTPLMLRSIVMVLVELVRTILLILVMPIRIRGNMLVGRVFLTLAGLLSSGAVFLSPLLGGVVVLEVAVVVVQCHVVTILFIELLRTYGLNAR